MVLLSDILNETNALTQHERAAAAKDFHPYD